MTDAPRLELVPWRALDGLNQSLEPALIAVLSGQSAERVLDRLLRDHRHATADQRAALAESLFGVGLWRRRLRAHQASTPLELLATLALDLGDTDISPLLDVARPTLHALTDWRDRWSVPDWLADTLEHEAGADAPTLAAALTAPGPIALRPNHHPDTLAAELAANSITTRPSTLAPDALIVTSPRPNLFAQPPGRFEVQDEGSQLLSHLLELTEGAHVLDLCAGAGGKSLHLSTLVGPTGLVHCTDIDSARLERLRQRAERARFTNLRVHHQLASSVLVPSVLVDAPCSELGALRRGPDLRWRLNPTSFATLPMAQLDLLDRAASHLTASGRIVYATCTLRQQENEAVVERFLGAHADFRCLPAPVDESLRSGPYFKTWPHRHGCDGFFAAVLVRG